ncbi:MAG: putative esterase [Limisphaerales bacterium]
MKEFRIPVRRSARYYTLGQPGEHIRKLWIVLHGYGMLASDFIAACKALDDGETLIVAPEGLSRFYSDGLIGKVGASWMTKEDREAEIKDQHNYFDALYRIVTHTLPLDTMVNVMGFSQGTAAAGRWASSTNQRVDNLVLWAGNFPHDVKDQSRLANINGYLVYGTRDPFLSADQVKEAKQFLNTLNMDFKTITFEGKHHLNSDTLTQLNRVMVSNVKA